MPAIPNDKRVGRYLDCSLNGIFNAYGYLDPNGRIGADKSTLYISFLQKPAKTSLFYEFELNRGTERIAGIGNDTHTDNVNLRAPADVYTSLGPGNTNVNFYVIRIDFQPTNDTVRVYRNPTSLTEPKQPTLKLPHTADLSFNRISLAAYANGNEAQFDQIRVANAWEQAIAASPEFAVQPAGSVTSSDIFKKIKISAQVLHGSGQFYYLLDDFSGVRIFLDRPTPLAPGDLVDVTGLVERKNQFLDLIEASAIKKGHSALPAPRPPSLGNPTGSSPFVWVEGVLTGIMDDGTKQTIELQAGKKQLMGGFPSGIHSNRYWTVGSRIKLTGIYLPPTGAKTNAVSEILLNSEADIEIITRPPWW